MKTKHIIDAHNNIITARLPLNYPRMLVSGHQHCIVNVVKHHYPDAERLWFDVTATRISYRYPAGLQ